MLFGLGNMFCRKTRDIRKSDKIRPPKPDADWLRLKKGAASTRGYVKHLYGTLIPLVYKTTEAGDKDLMLDHLIDRDRNTCHKDARVNLSTHILQHLFLTGFSSMRNQVIDLKLRKSRI